MFIWKHNQKRCNPNTFYIDEQGGRHSCVPPHLYEEIADDTPPTPSGSFTLDEEFYRTEDWETTVRPYTIWTRKSQEQLDAITAQKAKIADKQTSLEVAKGDDVINYLRNHTPAECEAYVQADVTDLASAKALLKKFAVALCVLSKQNFD